MLSQHQTTNQSGTCMKFILLNNVSEMFTAGQKKYWKRPSSPNLKHMPEHCLNNFSILFLRFANSEYVRILGGDGTVEFYQTGCVSSSHGSLVEVPFGKSDNITINIFLRELKSLIGIQFVVLRNGLNSGT